MSARPIANRATIARAAANATEATPVTLTLPGPPRTKKNSGKIWKVGKRTIIKPSEPWLLWRDAVYSWWMRQSARLGADVVALNQREVNCCALFYRDANRGDSTGYYQGLADVLEEMRVVANDRLITQWDGSRLLVDKANPRVVVTLTPVAISQPFRTPIPEREG